MNNTEDIYNTTAELWARSEPRSLSDFTARPRIFDLCGDIRGLTVVDLGCGEGYCARVFEERGAAAVEGIELSKNMVALAQGKQTENSIINYCCGDVSHLPYGAQYFDLAVGVFVFNYLSLEKTQSAFREIFRVLKPGGTFIFSVPHPSFPFIKTTALEPFYFDMKGHGYFSARGKTFNGKIYCRDGKALLVQMIPKTLEDYFTTLKEAGFLSLPEIQELGITDEMLAMDADFFGPLVDTPLHLVFKIRK